MADISPGIKPVLVIHYFSRLKRNFGKAQLLFLKKITSLTARILTQNRLILKNHLDLPQKQYLEATENVKTIK